MDKQFTNTFNNSLSTSIATKMGLSEKPDKPPVSPMWTLLHLSFAFFCIFLAFNGAETLQTSLYVHGGLGLVSIAVLYSGYFLAALLLAPMVVRQLTPKWSLFAAWFFYMLFIVSNYYPTWWTIVASAALLGPWCAVAWVANGVYITELAILASERTGKEVSVVLARYNSIFFFIFTTVHVAANILSGTILSEGALFHTPESDQRNHSYGNPLNHTITQQNGSQWKPLNVTYMSSQKPTVCGAQFCAYKQTHAAQIIQPNQRLVNILTSAFLGVMIVGIVATAFLRRLTSDSLKAAYGCSKALDTFKLMRDPRLLCLLPLLSLYGLFKSICVGVYTQAYISCSLGVSWVGYVMLTRGITSSLASLIPGILARYVHRVYLYAMSLSLLMSACLGWLFWIPDPQQKAVFFVLVAIEGLGTGCLRVLNAAFLGLLFTDNKEAAFAHYTLWSALINSLLYISGKLMCVAIQLYIALGILTIAIIGYACIEVLIKRNTRYTIKVPLTDPDKK